MPGVLSHAIPLQTGVFCRYKQKNVTIQGQVELRENKLSHAHDIDIFFIVCQCYFIFILCVLTARFHRIKIIYVHSIMHDRPYYCT